ncbi:uncharacterized protein BCR38DRAFT_472345 [Pseudomassariella vexata]|uniref:Uncharacterized protein n=1 Tax=Pseudomassariella vexata TaxID=1141098 RepID=A0A1Y2ECC0_9PEZI|nr:uncharacterized protein BCR38DRAFT_472345 [Pseudomassariella vexata]ORY68906.1 hypothetical protein BCR38DRAFT_472345 [Pseudomassariella vexata]
MAVVCSANTGDDETGALHRVGEGRDRGLQVHGVVVDPNCIVYKWSELGQVLWSCPELIEWFYHYHLYQDGPPGHHTENGQDWDKCMEHEGNYDEPSNFVVHETYLRRGADAFQELGRRIGGQRRERVEDYDEENEDEDKYAEGEDDLGLGERPAEAVAS